MKTNITRKLLNQGLPLVTLKSSKILRSPPWFGWPLIYVTNDHGCVPLVITLPGPFLVHGHITGFITKLTRRMPREEQELLTLLEHLSSPPVFIEVCVTRSLVLYVCFVDRCLSFCTFSFDHCVVCYSSIYGFWLTLWYIQTLLNVMVFSATFNNITVLSWW